MTDDAKPILFSAPMVRALLVGTKTQTRRLMRPQPKWRGRPPMLRDDWEWAYAERGQHLWVRETWAAIVGFDKRKPTDIPQDAGAPFSSIRYRATSGLSASERLKLWGRWRPSIFMLRWMSRITLEVTDVRAERLRDITEADAKAEGVLAFHEQFKAFAGDQRLTSGELCRSQPYRASYAVLWDELNEDRGTWLKNPWVWVVSFRVASVGVNRYDPAL